MTQPIQLSAHQDAAGASRSDVMAVRVMGELLHLAPIAGVIEVHQQAIADALVPQISVKSVYRALQDLDAAGCLEYDRIGNRPNEYRLIRDLAQTRIAIADLMRTRRSSVSGSMSEEMSGVSGAETVEVSIVAPVQTITPMSDAAGDTQSLRARDTESSSWSSSRSDTAVMSETNVASDRRVLSDPARLPIPGLIKAAHIEPTLEACQAMALLTPTEQHEALRRALKADEPNPKYLVQCVRTVLNLRGANALPSVLPLLYPTQYADACDEMSPSESVDAVVASPGAATHTPASTRGAAFIASEGASPSTVRGDATPRAGSRPRRVPMERRAFRLAQGELLFAWRAQSGLSQKDAAAAAHISPSALSTYELGKAEVPAAVIDALACVYDVPVEAMWPMGAEEPQ